MIGLGGMLAAGGRALRDRRRLVLAIYLCELGFSLVFMLAATRALMGLYGDRPLFSRGVHGDDTALLFALGARLPALGVMVWLGIALLVAWAVFSLYLTAGLMGALAGRPFAEAAGQDFLVFVRLYLLSAIPCAIALAVGCLGAASQAAIAERSHLARFIGRPLLGALPGLALLAVCWCAADYARADVVVSRDRRALRALARGFRRVVTAFAPLGHYGLYLLAWIGVSAAYLGVTFGHAFAGAAGAAALFAIRQLTAGARLAARVSTYAGQVARLRASASRT